MPAHFIIRASRRRDDESPARRAAHHYNSRHIRTPRSMLIHPNPHPTQHRRAHIDSWSMEDGGRTYSSSSGSTRRRRVLACSSTSPPQHSFCSSCLVRRPSWCLPCPWTVVWWHVRLVEIGAHPVSLSNVFIRDYRSRDALSKPKTGRRCSGHGRGHVPLPT